MAIFIATTATHCLSEWERVSLSGALPSNLVSAANKRFDRV
ncbi:MAG: hypothetical protein RSF40_10225 [Oscillospiraceae bacterium]